MELEDNTHWLRPVSLQEVHDAVFSLDPESAPGADGFTGKFFQVGWDFISHDLLNVVAEYFSGVPIPKSISSTLIVLIPKKDVPNTFADFRRISLCTFVNKVLTRILCDRLKSLMPRLISIEQSAFLQGRDIVDNVMLAQELIQHLDKKVRGHNICFKFDMMKAFDRVSWIFLKQLLLKFGFHLRFVELIMANLHASHFSVLVNGEPSGFFKASRGLKQGDPLSPYLFLLVCEGLSRGLHAECVSNNLAAYSLPRGSPLTTHLCFADDLIVFTRATRASLGHLFRFLSRYESATGQKLNKEKSSFVISKRSSLQHNRAVAALTGVKQGSLPFIYLGNMLFKGRPKKMYFTHIVDKIKARLDGWAGKLLSPGGRLVLIKHVLSAIPLHSMAALQPPKSILQEIERLFARFFWGTNEDGKPKKSWRTWSSITYPIEENGLGVRHLEDILGAFSCKQWWKWKTKTGIWANYVSSIRLAHSFAFKRLMAVDEFMHQHTRNVVRSGTSSLLYDDWLGGGSLASSYVLPTNDLSTASLRDIYSPDSGWDVTQLAHVLPPEGIALVTSRTFRFVAGDDYLVWEPAASGAFTLSSAFETIRRRRPAQATLNFIWDRRVPLKCSIFMWRLLNSLLPFPETLCKMGFQMVSKCPFCPGLDSMHHFFFACTFAHKLWVYFLHYLGLNSRDCVSLSSTMRACWSMPGMSISSQLSRLLPVYLCWELWRWRCKFLYDAAPVPSVHELQKGVTALFHIFSTVHPFSLPTGLRHFPLQFPFVQVRSKKMMVCSVQWQPPLPPFLKLNVDGSCPTSGSLGAGLCVRDLSGRLILADSIFLGHGNSFKAELYALLHGLRSCVSLDLQHVQVESDSQLLVNMVLHRIPMSWEYYSEFYEIWEIISRRNYTLTHIFREANAVADALAKVASSTQFTCRFTQNTMPQYIRGLVNLDNVSFPYVRRRQAS